MKTMKKNLLRFMGSFWRFAKTIGLQLLIGALLGFFIAYFSIDEMFIIPKEYTGLPLYINLIIIVFTYLLVITAHELGHFFVFQKNGIEMRALFLTIFMFIKENGKWTFKLKPNKITAMGGIAVPDLRVVEDDNDFKNLQKGFARALIAGPLASLVFGVIMLIFTVLLMLISLVYMKAVLFTFITSLSLITIFIIFSSFFKNEMVVGDFPAYKLAKSDDFFVAMQFYQYAVFSSEHERVRKENIYLKSVISKGLSTKLQEKDIHVFTFNIIDTFIVEYLAGLSSELPEIIDKYIEFLLENKEAFDKIKTSEFAMVLWFHIIRFLYLEKEDKERALELFEKMKAIIKKKTSVSKYMIIQTEHLLGIQDNGKYLNDKKNIKLSSTDGLYKNFDGYYADEIKLNDAITN